MDGQPGARASLIPVGFRCLGSMVSVANGPRFFDIPLGTHSFLVPVAWGFHGRLLLSRNSSYWLKI